MEKNYEVNEKYDEKVLINVLNNFDKTGEYVVEPGRNEIKKFEINILNRSENIGAKKKKQDKTKKNETLKMINVKKFKQKDFITNFFYKFKGSKAKRSYEYAKKLLKYKIKTPEPRLPFAPAQVAREVLTACSAPPAPAWRVLPAGPFP